MDFIPLSRLQFEDPAEHAGQFQAVNTILRGLKEQNRKCGILPNENI